MDEICLLQKSKCLSCFDLHYKVESRRSGLNIIKNVKLNLKFLSFLGDTLFTSSVLSLVLVVRCHQTL